MADEQKPAAVLASDDLRYVLEGPVNSPEAPAGVAGGCRRICPIYVVVADA